MKPWMRIKPVIPLLFMAFFLLGCNAESASTAIDSQDETTGSVEGKGYTDLSVEELQTWLANKDLPLLTFISLSKGTLRTPIYPSLITR